MLSVLSIKVDPIYLRILLTAHTTLLVTYTVLVGVLLPALSFVWVLQGWSWSGVIPTVRREPRQRPNRIFCTVWFLVGVAAHLGLCIWCVWTQSRETLVPGVLLVGCIVGQVLFLGCLQIKGQVKPDWGLVRLLSRRTRPTWCPQSRAVVPTTRHTAECSICLSEVIDENNPNLLERPEYETGVVTTTNCLHVFHRDCLEKWILSSPDPPTCPLCRADLRAVPTAALIRGASHARRFQTTHVWVVGLVVLLLVGCVVQIEEPYRSRIRTMRQWVLGAVTVDCSAPQLDPTHTKQPTLVLLQNCRAKQGPIQLPDGDVRGVLVQRRSFVCAPTNRWEETESVVLPSTPPTVLVGGVNLSLEYLRDVRWTQTTIATTGRAARCDYSNAQLREKVQWLNWDPSSLTILGTTSVNHLGNASLLQRPFHSSLSCPECQYLFTDDPDRAEIVRRLAGGISASQSAFRIRTVLGYSFLVTWLHLVAPDTESKAGPGSALRRSLYSVAAVILLYRHMVFGTHQTQTTVGLWCVLCTLAYGTECMLRGSTDPRVQAWRVPSGILSLVCLAVATIL